jgi:hypothetical protein
MNSVNLKIVDPKIATVTCANRYALSQLSPYATTDVRNVYLNIEMPVWNAAIRIRERIGMCVADKLDIPESERYNNVWKP